jgi:hypothetical protein
LGYILHILVKEKVGVQPTFFAETNFAVSFFCKSGYNIVNFVFEKGGPT